MTLKWDNRKDYRDAFLERDGQIVAWVGHHLKGHVILVCNRHQQIAEWIHSTAPDWGTAQRWCEEWARRPEPTPSDDD